jgi:hypothetical protein
MGDCKTLTATHPAPHFSFTGVSNSLIAVAQAKAMHGNDRARNSRTVVLDRRVVVSEKKAPLLERGRFIVDVLRFNLELATTWFCLRP